MSAVPPDYGDDDGKGGGSGNFRIGPIDTSPTTSSATKNNLVVSGVSSDDPEYIDYSSDRFYTFMDSFGTIVKELRRIEMEYDVTPTLSAYVFMSNSDTIDAVKHWTDGFSGELFLLNRSRNLGVASGDDTHEINGETVTHQTAVYGLAVKREEEKTKTFEDKQSIRARGTQELDFSSPWLQRDEQVEEIGNYLIERWSEPADLIDVTITPHPALTTGDIVAVEYQSKAMSYNTHIYHIISINLRYNSETGFEQTMQLRRFR